MPNRSPFSAYRSIPTRPASLLLVLLAATLGLSSCSDSQGNAASPPEAVAIPVRTVAVQTSSEQAWLRFAGVARSRQRAAQTFQVGGQIRQRFVDIGQHVDAGQVLMNLYNPNLEPAAEAANPRGCTGSLGRQRCGQSCTGKPVAETEIRIPGHLTRNLEAGQQLPVWFSL